MAKTASEFKTNAVRILDQAGIDLLKSSFVARSRTRSK